MSSTFRLCLALALTAATAVLSGCATIVKGTTQQIPISSDPAGARVAVDGQPAGTTPTKVTLNRKHSHVVTIEQEGFEVENVAVTNSMGGAVAGNIIAGGLIGWGVDAMSGAQYNLHPATVSVRLRPKNAPPPVAPTMDSLNRELEKLGELRASGKISEDEYGRLRASVLTTHQAPPATPAAIPAPTEAAPK